MPAPSRLARLYAWADQHRSALTWTWGTLWAAWVALFDVTTVGSTVSATGAVLPWLLLAAAALTAPMFALRLRHPAAALALAWANAVLQMATLSAVGFMSSVSILLALFSVSRHAEGRTRRAAAASVPAGAVVASAYLTLTTIVWPALRGDAPAVDSFTRVVWQGGLAYLLFVLFALGCAWLAGQLMRSRDSYRSTRAETLRAQREAREQRERTDLARDLHDVLAHSLSVMISLTDGVRVGTPDLPDRSRQALDEVSDTGRQALGDVRSFLARLRAEQPEELSATTVEVLCERMRTAGLVVELSATGRAPDIATPGYAAAVRILREALTNALRHGDTTQPVHLRIDWGDPIIMEVTNSRILEAAHASVEGMPGHWGLAGMRERAQAVSGSLDLIRTPSTWTLLARLPRHSDEAGTVTDRAEEVA